MKRCTSWILMTLFGYFLTVTGVMGLVYGVFVLSYDKIPPEWVPLMDHPDPIVYWWAVAVFIVAGVICIVLQEGEVTDKYYQRYTVPHKDFEVFDFDNLYVITHDNKGWSLDIWNKRKFQKGLKKEGAVVCITQFYNPKGKERSLLIRV